MRDADNTTDTGRGKLGGHSAAALVQAALDCRDEADFLLRLTDRG